MLQYTCESRVKIDSIQKTYRQEIQAQVIDLASHNKNSALTANRHEDLFKQQWQQWIMNLSQNIKPIEYATAEDIENEISDILMKKHIAHVQLVTQGLKEKPLSRRGFLKSIVITLHLESTRWASNVTKEVKT